MTGVASRIWFLTSADQNYIKLSLGLTVPNKVVILFIAAVLSLSLVFFQLQKNPLECCFSFSGFVSRSQENGEQKLTAESQKKLTAAGMVLFIP